MIIVYRIFDIYIKIYIIYMCSEAIRLYKATEKDSILPKIWSFSIGMIFYTNKQKIITESPMTGRE